MPCVAEVDGVFRGSSFQVQWQHQHWDTNNTIFCCFLEAVHAGGWSSQLVGHALGQQLSRALVRWSYVMLYACRRKAGVQQQQGWLHMHALSVKNPTNIAVTLHHPTQTACSCSCALECQRDHASSHCYTIQPPPAQPCSHGSILQGAYLPSTPPTAQPLHLPTRRINNNSTAQPPAFSQLPNLPATQQPACTLYSTTPLPRLAWMCVPIERQAGKHTLMSSAIVR